MIGGDMRQRPGFRIVVLLLLALFAVSALLCAMRCGSRELSYARIIETLWNADGGTDFLILCILVSNDGSTNRFHSKPLPAVRARGI